MDENNKTLLAFRGKWFLDAAVTGDIEAIKLLATWDPRLLLHADQTFAETALHKAAVYGREQVVDWLLNLKPDLALVRNRIGQTAFDCAQANGQTDVAKLIAQHSVNDRPPSLIADSWSKRAQNNKPPGLPSLILPVR